MSGWEQNVRRVTPYTPGEQPTQSGVIKLNTNENPYPPSPLVKRALEQADADRLRLYPSISCDELVEGLAKRYGLDKANLFVGVGSDDVLSMAFLTFFKSDRPILFPDITYSFYEVWAQVYGIPYKTVPLREDFSLSAEDYFGENGGVVIANPNAPTGICAHADTIESIIAANRDSVVIIDEAYVDFGAESVIGLIKKYDNLLVVQTFSKSRSMAGMRIGFAAGSEKLIRYLNSVKFSINSYTMNTLSQICGAAAIKDEEYFKKTVAQIIATRERAKERLIELGFTLTDSKANFLFAKHNKRDAKEIFTKLKEKNIYVRWWDKPRISDYLRITVGTDEQMDALYSALKQIL